MKRLLTLLLRPFAHLHNQAYRRWIALWSFSRLQAALKTGLPSSCVILGPVTLEGTANIRIGRNARIYPGVYLETQGDGRIDLGDDVVLSSGVHIVAFDTVTIGDRSMIGEYSSVRDANHRQSRHSMRDSGFDCAPIHIGSNVWIGRGACILKGVQIGANAIVGANAVVSRDVAPAHCALGIPARSKPVQFTD